MNWQQVWGVLKWVLAALIAGFVGQFGKSLALFLIKRRRNRKGIEAASNSIGTPPKAASSIHDEARPNQTKIEKKAAKAAVKRLKKS
jgi:biopolymer transport protein ExbB/TolQ